MSDWYDGGVGGHAYNDPDRGRIFRLTPKGEKPSRNEKPGPYATIDDAIEGLKSPNLATQFLAREKLLGDGEKSVPALKKLVESSEPNHQARALWVLDRIGGDARNAVIEQLGSQNDSFRALAVRILRRHGMKYINEIGTMVERDSSPEVQREFLLSLRNLDADPDRVLGAIEKYASKYDGSDRYLLETINITAGPRKKELYSRLATGGSFSPARFQLLKLLDPDAAAETLKEQLRTGGADDAIQKTLLAEADTIASPEAGKSLIALLSNDKVSPDVRQLALEKLSANLAGNWKALADDPELVGTLRKLLADGRLRSLVLATIAERGFTKLSGDVAKLVGDRSLAESARGQAIDTLAQLNPPGAASELKKLLDEPSDAIRAAAIDGLIAVQDIKTVRALLVDDKLAAKDRQAVANRLLGNPGTAVVLVKLIEESRLGPDLAKHAVSAAGKHPDSNVRILFEKYLPEDQRPKRLGDAIRAEEILKLTGDVKRGERIFRLSTAAQCKSCHSVNGEGATLGPDLSTIGKKYDRAALLETILEPSKAISHEYVPHLVETSAGLTYLGMLVEKNAERVVLKDTQSKLIRIPAGDVESIQEHRISLMPELVLKDVTAQDAADLLAYMKTLDAATKP